VILYHADVEPDADADVRRRQPGLLPERGHRSRRAVPGGGAPRGNVVRLRASAGGGASSGPGPAPKKQPNGSPAPKIGSLTVKPKSFRAKPLGGASAGGAFGTKVKLSLSAAATVTLAIEARRGQGFKVVTRVVKKLAAGHPSVAFSGQYRHAGKSTDLAPGNYRLSATAKGSAGPGPVKRTTFTVLPPA
jgi:hypothetical protein